MTLNKHRTRACPACFGQEHLLRLATRQEVEEFFGVKWDDISLPCAPAICQNCDAILIPYRGVWSRVAINLMTIIICLPCFLGLVAAIYWVPKPDRNWFDGGWIWYAQFPAAFLTGFLTKSAGYDLWNIVSSLCSGEGADLGQPSQLLGVLPSQPLSKVSEEGCWELRVDSWDSTFKFLSKFAGNHLKLRCTDALLSGLDSDAIAALATFASRRNIEMVFDPAPQRLATTQAESRNEVRRRHAISESEAVVLVSDSIGQSLCLDNLRVLTPKVAAILATHGGPLCLTSLSVLTVPEAEAISKCSGGLMLPALTSISLDAAQALCACRSFVFLSGLKEVSPELAAIIKKNPLIKVAM